MNFFEEHNIELPSLDEIDNMERPMAVAHFTKEIVNDYGSMTVEWFIVAGDEKTYTGFDGDFTDMLLYGKVIMFDVEYGYFTLGLELLKMGAELDMDFVPCYVDLV